MSIYQISGDERAKVKLVILDSSQLSVYTVPQKPIYLSIFINLKHMSNGLHICMSLRLLQNHPQINTTLHHVVFVELCKSFCDSPSATWIAVAILHILAKIRISVYVCNNRMWS